MSKIVAFSSKESERKKYIFRNRAVRIPTENILFPCISLYDQQTDILVASPGYERWYLSADHTS